MMERYTQHIVRWRHLPGHEGDLPELVVALTALEPGALQCWRTDQLEAFVKALTQPVRV
jgi:hypothetical protein